MGWEVLSDLYCAFYQLVSGFAWLRIYISRLGVMGFFRGEIFIPFSAIKQSNKFDLPKILVYQKLVEDLFKCF